MVNKFIGRDLVPIYNIDGCTGISETCSIEHIIHSIKIPYRHGKNKIPIKISAINYDTVWFNIYEHSKEDDILSVCEEPVNICLENVKANQILAEMIYLTANCFEYCYENGIGLNLILYSSQRHNLIDEQGVSILPLTFIENLYKNNIYSFSLSKIKKVVNCITLILDEPLLQEEILVLFKGISQNLTIIGKVDKIFLMDSYMNEGALAGDDLIIEPDNPDIEQPSPVFSYGWESINTEYDLTLVIMIDDLGFIGKFEEPLLDEVLIPNWLFDRLTIESNLIIYNKDFTFPTRCDNFNPLDLNIPTTIITNSEIDLMLLYNLYTYEEYKKVYREAMVNE